MEIRLVREELAKCHKAEGVNHYENCKWLSEKYLQLLRTNRVRELYFLRRVWLVDAIIGKRVQEDRRLNPNTPDIHLFRRFTQEYESRYALYIPQLR